MTGAEQINVLGCGLLCALGWGLVFFMVAV